MPLAYLIPGTPYPYRGESIACPLCGERAGTVVARTDRRLKTLTSLCCDGCGLVRTDPIPTDAELDAYYSGEYRQDYQLASARPSARHIDISRREGAQRLALLAPGLPANARVMDFGSGSGEFVKAAKDAGHHAVGVEPGSLFAAFARSEYGVEIVSGPHAEVDFPPESLDLITSHHVVEHLRDPVAALARMAGWLKPSGIVYIAVPDITRSGKPTFERFHFAHLYNFSPQTLEMAARKAGLEPDPRFVQEGTTMVFRKRPQVAADWRLYPDAAATVRAALPHVSVAGHILTGAWLKPMFRRALKYRRQVKAARTAPQS
jgi:SAM-dependent methyltransferase